MDEPRGRASAAQMAGTASAVVVLVVAAFTSNAVGSLLHVDRANRTLIPSGVVAVVALLVSIALLVPVMVTHARQTSTVWSFFRNPVASKPTAWREFAVMFIVSAWIFALAALLFGIIGL